ncbi:hypothetical protein [Paenibacillus sp. FSL R5-0473]|uniref:hypothetical protein n=1 Tax=Paenibacillus sp. FSL R5-0473 TaxID=2921642 RepID=UPI0030F91A4B
MVSSPAKGLNALNKLQSNQDENNGNQLWVAAIKADLCGKGAVFEQINSFETYKQESELLSKYICLNHLHDKVISVSCKHERDWGYQSGKKIMDQG